MDFDCGQALNCKGRFINQESCLSAPRTFAGNVLKFQTCLQVGISEAQLSELEEAESWVDTQAMLAEMEEQEELLHMVSH